jgi:hypothetical protein
MLAYVDACAFTCSLFMRCRYDIAVRVISIILNTLRSVLHQPDLYPSTRVFNVATMIAMTPDVRNIPPLYTGIDRHMIGHAG